MLDLRLSKSVQSPLQVLCLGAHADDIEIGCGGTVLALTDSVDVAMTWVVLSATPEREREARQSADLFLGRAKDRQIVIERFRDGFFPYTGGAIKDYFEDLKGSVAPDLVLTHYRNDLHQDHRLVSELTWNTFRDHLILEYEVPKYDGDLAAPNVFVPLDEATCQRKIDYVLHCFRTQENRQWFSADLFRALLRLRGMEANAPDRLAEAFYSRKLTLGLERTT